MTKDEILAGLRQVQDSLEKIAHSDSFKVFIDGVAPFNKDAYIAEECRDIAKTTLSSFPAIIAALEAQPNVEGLVRELEGNRFPPTSNLHCERFNSGLNFAIAIIRKWAEGEL